MSGLPTKEEAPRPQCEKYLEEEGRLCKGTAICLYKKTNEFLCYIHSRPLPDHLKQRVKRKPS